MKKIHLLFCLLLPLTAFSEERILDFHSDIIVKQDGWIVVTETIKVRSEGQWIRRGIYRDFPTQYRDVYGNNHEVSYKPLSAQRNGAQEEFRSERRGNGIRTYFGNANRFLPNGVHTYTFRYTASRMLGFFEDHDELYWNVTGLDWVFPIDSASASVTLDFEGSPKFIESNAFTGPMGAKGTAFSKQVSGEQASFNTIEVLAPHAGLTVFVSWPNGFISPPGSWQKFIWLLSDNLSLLVILGGLAGMLLYLVPTWNKFGRDPEEGLIVTRYEPPEGFSAASIRFIRKMYYDNKVLTAAVISLAVKGYLRIRQDDDVHTLVKTNPDGKPIELATGERELYEELFALSSSVVLENDNHVRIGRARKAHRASLRSDYRGRYFKSNGLLSLPALAIGLVSSIIALNVGIGPSPATFVVMIVMIVVFALFVALMKRPTGLGRRVLDEMLGFQDYLEIAEKDELNLLNPPEKTPELFEKFLPFALALGVEQHWAERFSSVFAALRGPNNASYHPVWYNGSWNSFDMSATTAGISSGLSSAISSSVTPPGSSSGSSGGGSSGGGGGGGGGGGW